MTSTSTTNALIGL